MSNSINNRIIGLIAILSSIVLMLQIQSTMSQITFSKDWRAGGKRSIVNGGYFNNDGMTIFSQQNHCDQITSNLIIIQELIRKETNELLKCQQLAKFGKIEPDINNNESISPDH
ncbi:hypothetical protein DERP_012827 [Dermatophagoides pteronyssinus]|uniref:Uncharacterized protein n=1 Tax=Dermatophagoides pteronyssinus TaxID=6956 RepID=A0ABQ8JF86_DERPT|nr:hypothetical protein DERP_012827 [Dermatophagoides pteronyssinus]